MAAQQARRCERLSRRDCIGAVTVGTTGARSEADRRPAVVRGPVVAPIRGASLAPLALPGVVAPFRGACTWEDTRREPTRQSLPGFGQRCAPGRTSPASSPSRRARASRMYRLTHAADGPGPDERRHVRWDAHAIRSCTAGRTIPAAQGVSTAATASAGRGGLRADRSGAASPSVQPTTITSRGKLVNRSTRRSSASTTTRSSSS